MLYLITPKSLRDASPEERSRICNGTGAAGSPRWLVWLLDCFGGLGINFKKASDIHDWMYHFFKHWYGKIFADFIYLINMLLISFFAIFALPLSAFVGNLVMFPFRAVRAGLYFTAVLLGGWCAFYNKGRPGRTFNLRPSIFKP